MKITEKENFPNIYEWDHEVSYPWTSEKEYVLWALNNRKLPNNKYVKIGKRNFKFTAWNTTFKVEYFWWLDWLYRVTNLSDNKMYYIKKWEEKTVWREWDILIDETDSEASRKHLKIKVDEEKNLFLNDISKHWTIIEEDWNKEKMESKKYSIRKINKEEINDLYEHKNPTKEFFEDLIKTYWEPKYTVEVKWRKWLFTDIIDRGEHIWNIWYVLLDWIYEPRFYRRSWSEWDRRCAPEMEWIRISKWESVHNASYESTTKVDINLRQALDDPMIKVNPNKSLSNPVIWSVIEDWKKEIKIDKLFPSFPNHANKFLRDKSISEIKKDYENLTALWLDYKNMESIPNQNFSYENYYLWKINVKAYRIKYNDKNLIFYFSNAVNDKKKQVRIENVTYEDSPLDVSWLPTKQINFWPLAAKPIEYNTQVSKEIRDDRSRDIYSKDWKATYYKDIRDVYQNNPIIKQYKKLEWLI